MNDVTTATSIERLSTGIEGLDSVLHGGLPRNRVYLVDGVPGTGKTTLALKFLLEGASNGEKGVYITLSETTKELQAVAMSHGWSLDGIQLYEMSQVADQLRAESQQTFFHPSDVELAEATKPMLEILDRGRPSRVVFDSLSEMRLLAGEPLRYRRQMLLLKQHFAQQDCTVLLLDDHVEAGGDLQIQSIVHGVIRLEHLPVYYGSERRRLSVLKMRGSTFRGGFHDFRIVTGGLIVFPRLVAAEHRTTFKREMLTSGIKELDQLLGGGIERGSSVLMLGPAGVGKSTLASHFAIAAAKRGEKSLILLFDETRQHVLDRSDSLRTGLSGYVNDGIIELRQVDPAEMSPGELMHVIRKSVEQDGTRHVRIDSFNGYLHAMPEEQFLLLHLHEVLTYLSHRGVVTQLVAGQHGVLGDHLANTVDVSYLADVVILLRYFEAEGRIHHAISVVKKRTSKHEDTIREFWMTAEGFRFSELMSDYRSVLSGEPIFCGGCEQLAHWRHVQQGSGQQ